jgi:subtilisin family serine protease
MKTKKLCVLLGLLALSPMALAAQSKMSLEIPAVPGEFIVKLKDGYSLKSLKGLNVTQDMNLVSGQFAVVKSNEKSAALAIAKLKEIDVVEYAEPNYLYHTINTITPVESLLNQVSVTGDEKFDLLWGLKNSGGNEPDRSGTTATPERGVAGADVNAVEAWKITKGSRDVVIAVIDTGIDWRHPDLANNMWTNPGEIAGNNKDDDGNGYVDDIYGWNAALKNGSPMDGNGHGTHCAGTIGAVHGNGGVAGVMADVKMMAVKFLTDEGSGSLADAIIAIDYATKMNVDIMSNSWGGGGFSQALFDSIKAASDRGIIFTAAAGNSTSNNDVRDNFPSNYRTANMVAVAAHAHTDQLASFSSYGKRTVHVAAPGRNVLSTTPNGQYAVFSGTSMATPHVSGVIGLLLSQEGRMPHAEMIERLHATSVPAPAYRRTTISGGRVDARNLLTNTRPVRNTPDESQWSTEALREAFESAHPYANSAKLTSTISVPGAKFLRLVVEKLDVEKNYDFLTIKDFNGGVLERLTGKGDNIITDYVEGDTLTVEFTSDSSQTAWGFSIKEVQIIR